MRPRQSRVGAAKPGMGESSARAHVGESAPGPIAKEDAALSQMVDSLVAHLARTELVHGETQQVGARLPASLVREAKKRTGLTSNTALLTFALASVALEDRFAEAFDTAHGQLDRNLDIGF